MTQITKTTNTYIREKEIMKKKYFALKRENDSGFTGGAQIYLIHC